jgi:hypothetical protein
MLCFSCILYLEYRAAVSRLYMPLATAHGRSVSVMHPHHRDTRQSAGDLQSRPYLILLLQPQGNNSLLELFYLVVWHWWPSRQNEEWFSEQERGQAGYDTTRGRGGFKWWWWWASAGPRFVMMARLRVLAHHHVPHLFFSKLFFFSLSLSTTTISLLCVCFFCTVQEGDDYLRFTAAGDHDLLSPAIECLAIEGLFLYLLCFYSTPHACLSTKISITCSVLSTHSSHSHSNPCAQRKINKILRV